MNKKTIIQIALKVLMYALGLISGIGATAANIV